MAKCLAPISPAGKSRDHSFLLYCWGLLLHCNVALAMRQTGATASTASLWILFFPKDRLIHWPKSGHNLCWPPGRQAPNCIHIIPVLEYQLYSYYALKQLLGVVFMSEGWSKGLPLHWSLIQLWGRSKFSLCSQSYSNIYPFWSIHLYIHTPSSLFKLQFFNNLFKDLDERDEMRSDEMRWERERKSSLFRYLENATMPFSFTCLYLAIWIRFSLIVWK